VLILGVDSIFGKNKGEELEKTRGKGASSYSFQTYIHLDEDMGCLLNSYDYSLQINPNERLDPGAVLHRH
jgi:hypothetical protein